MPRRQPLIEHYGFGELRAGGKTYTRDVAITPDGRIEEWWRREGHRLAPEDIEKYLGLSYDAVVIGTGYHGMMRVDPQAARMLAEKGAELHIEDSRRAVETYNRLVREGKRVLLLIHLTC